ncbi:MAG: MmcQ/YjbR family DNA-binding protein [Gemmataceae bacterium]
MTADDFRKLALDLPEAVESAHMNHPDFRVAGKVFATLGPAEAWGMVKLTSDQQRHLVATKPKMFAPVKGGWGRRGATTVILQAATKTAVGDALLLAWRNVAPKRLTDEQ